MNETWTTAQLHEFQRTGREPSAAPVERVPRPARPGKPTASEADHQRRVVQYLAILEAAGICLGFHVPNERKGGITRAILSGLGVRPGVSDLVILWPGGRTTFLELKREGGKASEAQEAFLAAVRAWGFEAEVSDRFDRSVEIIEGWRNSNGRYFNGL